MCPTPFFVWFTGRTGSTLLCDLLDSHPDIACRKEQFCEVKIDDSVSFPANARTFESGSAIFGRRLTYGSLRIDDPTDEQSLDLLKATFNQPQQACGFKLKFPNQLKCYPEIAEQLLRTPDLKVIELIRGNVLKQAISLRNVERIHQSGPSKSGNAVHEIELRPLQLDVDMAIRHAKHILRSREEFFKFSQRFADVLPVRYEDLLDNQPETLKRICGFLNVDAHVELDTEFKKATPDKIADAVANYDELVAATRGTDMESFLD